MGADEKIAFYLRHRVRIEEWAAVRVEASEAIEAALLTAADDLDQTRRTESSDGPWRSVGLSVHGLPVEVPDTVVAVQWNRGTLLKPGGSMWPFVGVKVPGLSTRDPWFEAVKQATGAIAAEHGLINRSETGWPTWGYLPLESESDAPIDLEKYASQCIAKLVRVSNDLAPAIGTAVHGLVTS